MMSKDMPLIEQVKTNLVHYNLWTSVKVHDRLKVLSGVPPLKLDLDDPDEMREWVIPKSMNDKQLQLTEIESWFSKLEHEVKVRPKRVTIALVNDDGTIVYYFIHDGIVKPRQN
jgi:tRNA-splicing endonuclease subunit Sen15